MSRQGWPAYFMSIAQQVATRATCDRLHVGAVLVRGKQLIASGYNGAVAGMPHCCDVGCDVVDNHCIRVVHAESNVIAQAAKHGIATEGATIYCTAFPCWPCFRLIVQAGISHVVYGQAYKPDARVLEVSNYCNIGLFEIAADGVRRSATGGFIEWAADGPTLLGEK